MIIESIEQHPTGYLFKLNNNAGLFIHTDVIPEYQTDIDNYLAEGKTIVDLTIPQIEIPNEISMRQLRLILLQRGLLSNVATIIAQLPSPDKEAAEIEWEYSSVVQRGNRFVSILGTMLGLTESDIDQLFIDGILL